MSMERGQVILGFCRIGVKLCMALTGLKDNLLEVLGGLQSTTRWIHRRRFNLSARLVKQGKRGSMPVGSQGPTFSANLAL